MVAEAADRLVAWPARQLAGGLDHCGDRIKRRPVPRARWAKNAHRRGSKRGSDMQEPGIVGHGGICGGERKDGIAEVRPGEIPDAALVSPHDLRRNLLLSRSPDDPDPGPLGREAFRQICIVGGGPALGWPDRARRECHYRTAVGCEPQPLAPRRQFGPWDLELR